MRADPTRTSGRRKAAAAADLDCATAFQTIALDCVAAIRAHHSSACAGDAEAVHQIRVAITRLRAAVAFFAPIVIDAEWLRLKKEIVWLNGPLGAARDTDVVLEYARRKRYRAWTQRLIGKRLDQQQMRDHRRLVRCLGSVRTQRLLAAMARWIRQGPWLERYQRSNREALQGYCARELARWHQRLVRKGRRLKTLGAAPRHRLRIRAKRFRYMLEALAEIGSLRGSGDWYQLHRLAKQMQRALGDLRDLKRFADLADRSLQAKHARRDKKRPPGYRARREKLLSAAMAAHRDLKRAGAF
ncbi:CHAD domain-containing protein [Bradyrhizobium sp. WSM 1738]|uniref:CHAD domain-containing protein n=1 Tax=Bradyrhizobium hereditatis TaxID=2821405 RepID=UPI001CE238CA|nr:CHAD domain-containing protein [Bradyrhizobium hereditatis]MCA6113877.1 CHAD domain-containing protein [Bradyrhizobium hereditatis]